MQRFRCLVCAAVLCGLSAPAAAVINIRFERWSVYSHVRPEKAPPPVWRSFLGVEFDATVTAADLASGKGLRFAIAERSPGGDQVLAYLDLAPCATLPAAGADVYISTSIELVCGEFGRLRAPNCTGWTATWCDLPQQQVCAHDGFFPLPGLPIANAEPFEFVLLDENGQEGSFPTPDDVTVCDPAPGHTMEFVAPEFAGSGRIGIYADPGANLCSATVQPFVPFRWYIVANLAGMTRCGLTTAEMGVNPLPPGLLLNSTPHPGAYLSGGSLFGGRAVIGFTCERGTSDLVVLYTLDGVATAPVQDYVLHLGAANPPTNDTWPYPWTDLCPYEHHLRRRLQGGDFVINPAPGHTCEATVHVQGKSWTAVKELYR